MSVVPEEVPQPRSSALVRLVPWGLWLLILAIAAATFVLFPPIATERRDLPAYLAYGLSLMWGPFCLLVGALITSNRRGNRVGWLLVGLGLLVTLMLFASGAGETKHPAADAFNILSDVGYLLWVSLFGVLILLFPDGQPSSRRWRPVVWFAALWPAAFLLIGLALAPEAFLAESPSGPTQVALQVALAVLMSVTFILVTSSAVLRFIRSRGIERQQLKWFAFATAFGLAVVILTRMLPAWGLVIGILGLFGPLAGIAVALFRHRLYDIDVLINRAFVYGALIAILAGLYTASIRLFNLLFVGATGLGSEEALVITTLILATTFTPIRKKLEQIVERRYKKPAEAAAPSQGAPSSVELADPAIEARLRAIVRDELERSGRAS
jgi:hypothetical protein